MGLRYAELTDRLDWYSSEFGALRQVAGTSSTGRHAREYVPVSRRRGA
jgi:hypothetical protein